MCCGFCYRLLVICINLLKTVYFHISLLLIFVTLGCLAFLRFRNQTVFTISNFQFEYLFANKCRSKVFNKENCWQGDKTLVFINTKIVTWLMNTKYNASSSRFDEILIFIFIWVIWYSTSRHVVLWSNNLIWRTETKYKIFS